MRVQFLGTGPSRSIPRTKCRCSACADARRGGKSARLRSSILISDRSSAILIDIGPDILKQITSLGKKALRAAFLTHTHMDAIGGLKTLDVWLKKHRPNQIVSVYAHPGVIQNLKEIFKICPRLKPIELPTFKQIGISGWTIKSFDVEHSFSPDFPTVGFLVNGLIGYASDVKHFPKKSQRLLVQLPLLILDAAAYFPNHIPTHLNTSDSIRLGHTLKVDRLILTQIGHTYPDHKTAQQKTTHFLRKQKWTTPTSVQLAYDGLIVSLSSENPRQAN